MPVGGRAVAAARARGRARRLGEHRRRRRRRRRRAAAPTATPGAARRADGAAARRRRGRRRRPTASGWSSATASGCSSATASGDLGLGEALVIDDGGSLSLGERVAQLLSGGGASASSPRAARRLASASATTRLVDGGPRGAAVPSVAAAAALPRSTFCAARFRLRRGERHARRVYTRKSKSERGRGAHEADARERGARAPGKRGVSEGGRQGLRRTRGRVRGRAQTSAHGARHGAPPPRFPRPSSRPRGGGGGVHAGVHTQTHTHAHAHDDTPRRSRRAPRRRGLGAVQGLGFCSRRPAGVLAHPRVGRARAQPRGGHARDAKGEGDRRAPERAVGDVGHEARPRAAGRAPSARVDARRRGARALTAAPPASCTPPAWCGCAVISGGTSPAAALARIASTGTGTYLQRGGGAGGGGGAGRGGGAAGGGAGGRRGRRRGTGSVTPMRGSRAGRAPARCAARGRAHPRSPQRAHMPSCELWPSRTARRPGRPRLLHLAPQLEPARGGVCVVRDVAPAFSAAGGGADQRRWSCAHSGQYGQPDESAEHVHGFWQMVKWHDLTRASGTSRQSSHLWETAEARAGL